MTCPWPPWPYRGSAHEGGGGVGARARSCTAQRPRSGSAVGVLPHVVVFCLTVIAPSQRTNAGVMGRFEDGVVVVWGIGSSAAGVSGAAAGVVCSTVTVRTSASSLPQPRRRWRGTPSPRASSSRAGERLLGSVNLSGVARPQEIAERLRDRTAITPCRGIGPMLIRRAIFMLNPTDTANAGRQALATALDVSTLPRQ